MGEEEEWGAVRVSMLARYWYGGGEGAVSQGKQGGLWKLKRQEMDFSPPASLEVPRLSYLKAFEGSESRIRT